MPVCHAVLLSFYSIPLPSSNMSNQVVFIRPPFHALLYAELSNGIIRAGAKRDISAYDVHGIPITSEWATYTENTRFTYAHSSGKLMIVGIQLEMLSKVINTGYVIPIFVVTGGSACDVINDLGAHLMNTVSQSPRQPKQCIAPPRAIAPPAVALPAIAPSAVAPLAKPSSRKVRRDSTDSTKCVYKESLADYDPKCVVFSK